MGDNPIAAVKPSAGCWEHVTGSGLVWAAGRAFFRKRHSGGALNGEMGLISGRPVR